MDKALMPVILPPNIWPFELGRYLDMTIFVITVAVSVIVALTAAAIGYRWRGGAAAVRAAGWVLLAGSVASILAVTLGTVASDVLIAWRRSGSLTLPSRGSSNWTPFKDILDEWHNINHALGMINIFGNVALFIPTGFLAALLMRRTWAAFIIAPVLSAVIEYTQLFVGLAADIDDIILNSVGGAIGVCVGLAIRRFRRTRTPAPTSSAPPGSPRAGLELPKPS